MINLDFGLQLPVLPDICAEMPQGGRSSFDIYKLEGTSKDC